VTDKPDPKQQRKAAPPISFEVQVFAAGKWATELVLQDRQDAESEALRSFESSRRPLAVRVVREEVDNKTSLITATTVFRRSREDERTADERDDRQHEIKAKIAEIKADRRQTSKAASRQEPTAAAPARKPAASRGTPGWVWPLIFLTVLVVAGVLTLVKLHSWFLG
jgi:hypothetical protein